MKLKGKKRVDFGRKYFVQGCKFSDFCLISENFTSKYLKMVFEISSLQPFLDGFMISSDFQTRSVYHFRFFQ